jgi:hypothetical protein
MMPVRVAGESRIVHSLAIVAFLRQQLFSRKDAR